MKEPTWIAEATLPFTWGLSKNRIWRRARQGGYYMTEEARDWKQAMVMALKTSVGKEIIAVDAKVWIDIMVGRPDMRGDPINVMDICADACQIALELDDRRFALWRLDWELKKREPYIRIRVGIMVTRSGNAHLVAPALV